MGMTNQELSLSAPASLRSGSSSRWCNGELGESRVGMGKLRQLSHSPLGAVHRGQSLPAEQRAPRLPQENPSMESTGFRPAEEKTATASAGSRVGAQSKSANAAAGSSVGAGLTPPPALAHTHWASGPGAHTEFNRHTLCDGAANGCCLKTSAFGVLCSSLV